MISSPIYHDEMKSIKLWIKCTNQETCHHIKGIPSSQSVGILPHQNLVVGNMGQCRSDGVAAKAPKICYKVTFHKTTGECETRTRCSNEMQTQHYITYAALTMQVGVKMVSGNKGATGGGILQQQRAKEKLQQCNHTLRKEDREGISAI